MLTKVNRSLNSRSLETCTKLLTQFEMMVQADRISTVRARVSRAYIFLKIYAAIVYTHVENMYQRE